MRPQFSDFTPKALQSEIVRAYQHVFDEYMPWQLQTAARVIDCVESPLEAKFMVWFKAVRDLRVLEGYDDETPTLWWDLEPQSVVTTSDGDYRLDFSVQPTVDGRGKFWWKEEARRYDILPPKIAVELDGHEFHERTSEQVAYRNARDRALQADGWVVLHFSGSEIARDSWACANAVWDCINKATNDCYRRWVTAIADEWKRQQDQ